MQISSLSLLKRTLAHKYPEKILQFGTGNFLRAFICWQVQLLNEHTDFNAGIICAKRSLNKKVGSLNRQDSLYHTFINGINEHGEFVSNIKLIESITRELDLSIEFDALLECAKNPDLEWIFSNTTEAGIVFEENNQKNDHPPHSFPAKLTRFLWARFEYFKSDLSQNINHAVSKGISRGMTIIPCELIEDNGATLKEYVLKYAHLWNLDAQFIRWINEENKFYSSLVDRIVPGFPHERAASLWQELGVRDDFLVAAEYFYLWVIEVPQNEQQDFKKRLKQDIYPLNIIITDDISPYKQQKVAILNGAHTALVPVAYLAGIDTVSAALNNPVLNSFLEELIFNEIIPTLILPEEDLKMFAREVLKRFNNPHIKHLLASIALNGMSKFKTRNLPQLLKYQRQTGQLPPHLCFSLAALIVYYRGSRYVNGQLEHYIIQDDQQWLDFYHTAWKDQMSVHEIRTLVNNVLGNIAHWECDLNMLPNFSETISGYVLQILQKGTLQNSISLTLEELS